MSVSSVSNSCSFKGIGCMQIGEKVKLLRSSKLEKIMFSNPKLVDTFEESLSSKQAQDFLSAFGKYAKKVVLDPTHLYRYDNAHGAAQLLDITTKKNVIQGVKSLKHPIGTLVKNIFERIVKK